MKLFVSTAILILITFSMMGMKSPLRARPTFWTSQDTPSPSPTPYVYQAVEPPSYLTATPTPVIVPALQGVSPTPTPRAGLKPVDPTAASLFSVVIPGSGEVYAGDPVKGIVVAALFGVGLWQTIDNLSLHEDSNGVLVSKDENAGSFAGLATLVIYGYQIQDSADTANSYNKRNYLTFNLGISPEPNIRLAYLF